MTAGIAHAAPKRGWLVLGVASAIAVVGVVLGIDHALDEVEQIPRASIERDQQVRGRFAANSIGEEAFERRVVPSAVSGGLGHALEFAFYAAVFILIAAPTARRRMGWWVVAAVAVVGSFVALGASLAILNQWPFWRGLLRSWDGYVVFAVVTAIPLILMLVRKNRAGGDASKGGGAELTAGAAIISVLMVLGVAARLKLGEPRTWTITHAYTEMQLCESRYDLRKVPEAFCSCLASAVSKHWDSPRAYALAREDAVSFKPAMSRLEQACAR